MNRRALLALIGVGMAEPYVRRAYSFIWAPPEQKVWVHPARVVVTYRRVVLGEFQRILEASGWFVTYSYAALDQEGRIVR